MYCDSWLQKGKWEVAGNRDGGSIVEVSDTIWFQSRLLLYYKKWRILWYSLWLERNFHLWQWLSHRCSSTQWRSIITYHLSLNHEINKLDISFRTYNDYMMRIPMWNIKPPRLRIAIDRLVVIATQDCIQAASFTSWQWVNIQESYCPRRKHIYIQPVVFKPSPSQLLQSRNYIILEVFNRHY